ncbi:hypothetical protein BZA77DRAFT_98075 [Pyronema omphalodes]|nr:hypothetical protein BZA77DRAFT_98075 [Pyronema omphalodes]
MILDSQATALVLLVVGAAIVANAQNTQNAPDEITDFCFVSGSSARFVNNKAYIYGGWSTFTGFENYTGPNNYLRTIDFSKSLLTSSDVSTYVSRSLLPDNIPRNTYTTLWPFAKDKLGVFFGYHEASRAAVALKSPTVTTIRAVDARVAYDTKSNQWSVDTVKTTSGLAMLAAGKDKDGAILKVASSMSAWIPSLNRGYYLGGLAYKDAPDIPWDGGRDMGDHHGFLIYDANQDSIRNETQPFPNGRDGGLVHITTATDELLLAFGGRSEAQRASPQKARSMREFWIYSTKQSKWVSYISPDTVVVPDPRANFCTVVKEAPDGSSWQVFIYGGASGQDLAPTDTVWVLSIPSFDWVQLPGNATDSSRVAGKRWDPACTDVGKRYMLSWGGRHYVGAKNDLSCDTNGNNVFLLDLTSGMWVDKFNVDAGQYQVPQPVVEAIGGTVNGSATKMQPNGGFDSPEVKALMQFNVKKSSNSSPDSVSGGSDAKSTFDTPATTSNHTAAIAGVVGGVAGVAIIAGLVWFFLRRRKAAISKPNYEYQGYPEAPGDIEYVKYELPQGMGHVYPPPVTHPVTEVPGDTENERPREMQAWNVRYEMPVNSDRDHSVEGIIEMDGTNRSS